MTSKVQIGVNEDGTPHFLYHDLPDDHAVYTGPIQGSVTLADGSSVDVGEHWINAPSQDVADEIMHRVSMRYVAEGHPLHQGAGAVLLLPDEVPPSKDELGLADGEAGPFHYVVPEKFADEVFGKKRKSHLAARMASKSEG